MTTRRDFLRVSLLTGGTIAFGFLMPGCHGYDAATAERADKTGEFAPNAWIRIQPDDRVVFVLASVEMGQGTMTSHTTLVAEELKVDPRKIHVELAPANPAYKNQDPQVPFQITGGSNSVKGAFIPLRRAGAAAREMLVAAAAATWGVPTSECKAEDCAVVHAASGKRLRYGELTRTAARQAVPSDPALTADKDFKWIGKSLERLDGRMKVDGSGVYGIDFQMKGLLIGVVVRSPVFGGKVASFDGAEAKRQEGVIDVFEIPSGIAVVATSTWRAMQAAKLVKVTWNEGRLAGLSTAGMRAEYKRLSAQEGKVVKNAGSFADAARAGRSATTGSASGPLIEAVYEVPYLAHATMEPQNATAHVTDGKCEIWTPTQSPALALEEARRILGLAPEAITVHQMLVGGGFGRRGAQDYVIEAIHMSRHVKRPVKNVFSREDDMKNDFYRPATYNVMRGAVDGSGHVSAWFHRIVSQSIIAQVLKDWAPAFMAAAPQAIKPFFARSATHLYDSGLVPDDTAIEGASDFAYSIPNLRVEHVLVEPGVPVGFWRSVGHSENAFMVESFLDELAHAAGRDPLEVRRELLKSAPRHLGVLDAAAKAAGWGTKPPPGVFRGVAQVKSFGSYCAQVAEVSVTGGKIRVHRVVCAIDCGTVVNPDLVRAQMESAIVFGLSAALKQAITFSNGRVEQSNFHDYPMLRMHEAPEVVVHIVPSKEPPSGVGEPGVPPAAPAVANAIFAATGKRLRTMPLTLG